MSYTSFRVWALTAPTNVSFSESDAAGVKFSVGVKVSNTGQHAGQVTLFVTYYKQTDGVVRWARMLCGFTKVHIAAGVTQQVVIEVEVADLARWDPVRNFDSLAQYFVH